MVLEQIQYEDEIVKKFIWATVFWGIFGILVGLTVALQLVLPSLNLSQWFSLGKLRPIHTNSVIFGFCGNAIFASVYYSTPRLLKANMWSLFLSKIHFYGWQLIFALSAVSLILGMTSSKEYAEMEWPIDIAIAVVWVLFGFNYFMSLIKRREKVLYVSIWFYIATIVAVAMLHVVNSLSYPVHFFKSYSIYSGVQDALVQWWYGHNAVAFIFTTPFLGLAYYFIPKASGKPVYSYRLSVVHFWSLIFIYIWAGPHHLQYSSLPEWLQSLGMVFSIMLIAPSWGGGLNLLFTLRMAWDKVKDDVILKFFVTGVCFYLLATLEGPLLSIKTVNGLAHNTDWIIAHVHGGTLGWNSMMIFGVFYWLVPKVYQTPLYSQKLAETHYSLGMIGTILYIISMWVSGLTQGVMTQSLNKDGSLKYPQYIEIVQTVLPLHVVRVIGGAFFLLGFFLMVYNLLATALQSVGPVVSCGYIHAHTPPPVRKKTWHAFLERRTFFMWVFVTLVVMAGSLIEIIPIIVKKRHFLTEANGIKPYTQLEIEGRDIYMREGCNNCHTQMVRPLVHETKRYGPYSQAKEYVYDFPHLWGSKRTGPDLFRIGGKYNHSWHWKHMIDPRSLVPESIMPAYSHLLSNRIEPKETQTKMSVLNKLGVPYSPRDISMASDLLDQQALQVVEELREQGIEVPNAQCELIALISYLQRLGKNP